MCKPSPPAVSQVAVQPSASVVSVSISSSNQSVDHRRRHAIRWSPLQHQPDGHRGISVQKDAAANAIYGARGANGVIMVTTKQGRDRDAVVTVDAKWGSNHRATPNYKRLGVQNYYETAYRALYNSKPSTVQRLPKLTPMPMPTSSRLRTVV